MKKTSAPNPEATRKTFVLDTNVLLHNADSIDSFADNNIVLPMTVIEELDRFKAESNELGRNARQVIRALDALRGLGSLRDGVPTPAGGTLKIVMPGGVVEGMQLSQEDNRIIGAAYQLKRKGERVIFVSKDINARIKADALGLQAMDFEKQKVNFDELYSGYREICVSRKKIVEFYENDLWERRGLGEFPNEFIILRERGNNRQSALARVMESGRLRHLSSQYERVWNVSARNKEQRMAMELLMDPDVALVTLVGQAGTGKTLLAMAAALHTTLRFRQYERILVSRPIVPLGRDIGYLPGAKEEKLSHWMQPIFDNLGYLLHESADHATGKKKKSKMTAADRIDELMRNRVLQLEALTYIRGRSIPNQYIIIDEAQNLTPHEVKTIISRAGEGSKMVLTGDPYQIDNPYLDASSNGLTYTAERLKTHRLHGHITLKRSERSELAAVAAEQL
ncbi:MAG: PhoH family protein [Lentisphaerae bacterium]|nr:PhoH family protein [Lentisphaerota bacterium]